MDEAEFLLTRGCSVVVEVVVDVLLDTVVEVDAVVDDLVVYLFLTVDDVVVSFGVIVVGTVDREEKFGTGLFASIVGRWIGLRGLLPLTGIGTEREGAEEVLVFRIFGDNDDAAEDLSVFEFLVDWDLILGLEVVDPELRFKMGKRTFEMGLLVG